jgi:DNA polymerase
MRSTDWRAALRASGAAPEPKKPAPAMPAAAPAPTPGSAPPKPPSKKYEFPGPADVAAASSDAGSPAPPVSRAAGATVQPTTASPASAPAGSQASARIPGVDAPLGIVVGDGGRDLFGTTSKLGSLKEVADVVAGCTRCPLYASATNPVPGEGSPTAELVCVGEAPGEKEDLSGRPFVGQSGELLTKILAAISLRREDVFICNVLKHRPPGNRNPLPEEVVACSPYLVQQLELIRPKVIVAFGTFAAQTLLNTKIPIGKLRGSIHRYHGVPLIVTYHPAALLRNPAWKRPTWEDVQLARRILDNAPRA